MNLSFLRYFKKDKPPAGAIALASPPIPPIPPIEKPASERFGKTVMPNSSRIVGLEPSRNFPVPAPVSRPSLSGPRKISLGGSGTVTVAPIAPIAPCADRTIALHLIDLAPHIPGEMLKPGKIDPQHRIILPASEIERGMATGRPTVLLRAIYQQAPELFTCEVDAANKTEVALPVGKVLEQFGCFQVRDDQICDQAVPQVETPFLKVTLEDGERFGTPVAPLQTSDQPPVKIQPAIAGTIAAAQPEAVAEIKPPTPVRMPVPEKTSGIAGGSPAKAPIRLNQPPAAPPIRAKLSPNGTGVPATERVPASSGPPVPTPLPVLPTPSTPARIPFKVSPPSNDLRPPVLRAARSQAEAIEFSTAGPRIRLPLRSILRGISSIQLSGSIEEVPEAAVIELPFSIIEPQLSLGRIAISPAQFQAAMPEEYRRLFKAEAAGMPVALSLPEVLRNLPNESLQIRGDQEEFEVGEAFETPFSQKMAEDAARMEVPEGPIAKPAIAFAEPEPMPKPARPAAKEASVTAAVPIAPPALKIAASGKSEVAAGTMPGSPTPATGSEPTPTSEPVASGPAGRTALQVALDTDETLTAKSVVAHASRLPGVLACAIVFSDGLSLAGNIPPEYEAEALCAMAPSIVRRISEQMMRTSLGSLSSLTLFCAKAPVSFFAHGNICLAAIHSAGELAAEIRDRLGCIAQELARMYANQPND
jgi:predicted regulator of Ras-like GTPase activity (Roadblock/LC7/MglB family)